MDSVFTSVHRSVILLDLVDDAWAADCLSDDGSWLPCCASDGARRRQVRRARSRRALAPARPAAPDAGRVALFPRGRVRACG